MSKDYKRITTPLTDEVVSSLKAGDNVLITGDIYTSRDAAHKRFISCINEGKELPFDVKGQVIYYVGPAPAKPGYDPVLQAPRQVDVWTALHHLY